MKKHLIFIFCIFYLAAPQDGEFSPQAKKPSESSPRASRFSLNREGSPLNKLDLKNLGSLLKKEIEYFSNPFVDSDINQEESHQLIDIYKKILELIKGNDDAKASNQECLEGYLNADCTKFLANLHFIPIKEKLTAISEKIAIFQKFAQYVSQERLMLINDKLSKVREIEFQNLQRLQQLQQLNNLVRQQQILITMLQERIANQDGRA